MMHKKGIALLLALVMATALFAACSAPANNTPPAASTAPEQSVSEQSAAQESPTPTVDRIKASGKLIMLTNAAFAPFEYLNAQNEIDGVDIEIAHAIANELGVKLEIVDMDFDGIVMAIQNGQGDLALAGMTATDSRRQSIDFSIDYLDSTQLIIVQEGNANIKTPDDLVGKTIGVQQGTTGALFVEEIEGANMSAFKTGPDAGMALANGQLDAVVLDEMPAQKIVDANKGLIILEEPLTVEQYAIGIAKGNDDLKAVVDSVLEKLLAAGQIDALIAKHMG